jgi:hypothetical protein
MGETEQAADTTAAAEPAKPTCPACGSEDLRPRKDVQALGMIKCYGPCGQTWHPSDLEGERHAFLKGKGRG